MLKTKNHYKQYVYGSVKSNVYANQRAQPICPPMKISLFFLSFCFFFQFTFAQYDKKEKIKYCFQSHYSKTSKQQLHSFLDSYETLPTIDKRGKFRCIDCEDYRSHYDTSQLEIPDSIHGLFKVTNIVKKKNNYQKKGKKIHRKTLFLIDLE